MVKGGKKGRRGKKNKETGNKKIIYKEDDQEYAYVVKLLGDSRVTVRYIKNNQVMECIGIICGKMKKRVWITVGDLVIVSIREFQENKVDILYKYHATSHRNLIKQKEISEEQYNVICGQQKLKNNTNLENHTENNNSEDSEEEINLDVI